MRTHELVLGSLVVALTAVGAQLSLFVGEVPLTFQVVGVALAGLFLPPGRAFTAMLAYVLLGLAGAPVFAGFRGGPGVVLGATGGFILSMPLAAAAVSRLRQQLPTTRLGMGAAGLVIIPIMYACGSAQLAWVLGWSWWTALIFTLQFLFFDGLKVLLAATIAYALRHRVPGQFR